MSATSSGTVGATLYRVSDLVDTIARRCGVSPEKLTPDGLDEITGTMWRTLASWSSRGVNLWRLYLQLYAMIPGQQEYALAQGDIDIMDAMRRQPVRLSATTVTSSAGGTVASLSDADVSTACTQASINGNLLFDFGSSSTPSVGLVGVNSFVARTYTLVFETSADGVTFTQVLAPVATAYAAAGWNWYAVEPSKAARYFRVREAGGAILSLGEVVLAQDWSDTTIARWGLDDWSANPNKRSQGIPRQYYLDRQLTPVVKVWQVPSVAEQFNCMAIWIHRHIEDVGAMSNILNIPERWYQPLVDHCAWVSLPGVPGADLKRYDMLKDLAASMSLPDAEKDERDKAPIKFGPNIMRYTR